MCTYMVLLRSISHGILKFVTMLQLEKKRISTTWGKFLLERKLLFPKEHIYVREHMIIVTQAYRL